MECDAIGTSLYSGWFVPDSICPTRQVVSELGVAAMDAWRAVAGKSVQLGRVDAPKSRCVWDCK